MKIGDIMEAYVPWECGIKQVKVTDRRVPNEGELFLIHRAVFKRASTRYLRPRIAEKVYYIVEMVDPPKRERTR